MRPYFLLAASAQYPPTAQMLTGSLRTCFPCALGRAPCGIGCRVATSRFDPRKVPVGNLVDITCHEALAVSVRPLARK